MKCIVGLGNPGDSYQKTRHNVGFRVVDGLEERHDAQVRFSCKSYRLTEYELGAEKVHLLKPMTYMNCSGHGVMDYLKKSGTDVSDILVVVDDVYLPLGRLRIRRSGGDGGHNGMASIMEFLGTEAFARLRLGVGSPSDTGELATYVLHPFGADEEPVIEEGIAKARDAIDAFVTDGIVAAMNKFNG
jgi:PTH1 family peptidyl-tRNA hydrolase